MYLEYVLANDEHVKEVRLFRLGPLFLSRYKELAERFHREESALATRRSIVTHLLSLLATLAFYGAYVAMAALAAVGRLTLGNMTMYVLAFRSGQQSFQSILNGIGTIYEHNLYMSNLFAYLDATEQAHEPPAKGPTARGTDGGPSATVSAAALPTEAGIRLDRVSFRYPGQSAWVLREIDLFIPRGQSVALVGQNGAGKTTLVKLVTRLYEPTEGRLLLDGKDLRDWDRAALLERFGVVFQDFNQYQLKLRENVGVGSVEHMSDEDRVLRAVERGGAKSVVPGGGEVPLAGLRGRTGGVRREEGVVKAHRGSS
jgi:ATP-binding cassette subfamily B protein